MYEKLAKEIGKLVQEKNKAYGDSFNRAGEILEILYPHGIGLDDYTDMLAIIRVIDKLFRIATDKGAFDESPWRDIVGYALLGAANYMEIVEEEIVPAVPENYYVEIAEEDPMEPVKRYKANMERMGGKNA